MRADRDLLLGTVAYRTGQPLEWDAESFRAPNSSEAQQFVRKAYRAGFEVQGL